MALDGIHHAHSARRVVPVCIEAVVYIQTSKSTLGQYKNSTVMNEPTSAPSLSLSTLQLQLNKLYSYSLCSPAPSSLSRLSSPSLLSLALPRRLSLLSVPTALASPTRLAARLFRYLLQHSSFIFAIMTRLLIPARSGSSADDLYERLRRGWSVALFVHDCQILTIFCPAHEVIRLTFRT